MESTLVFNVVTLLQEPASSTREYIIDDALLIEGAQQRFTGRARFDRTPRGVLVRAAVSAVAADECSRCLRPTSTEVHLQIEEEFIPTIDVATGARIDLSEGEFELYRINAHHEIDLGEPIAHYWAMAVPMAPLCRDDCPGLCPSCGAERDGGHACSEQQVDERWSRLAELAEN